MSQTPLIVTKGGSPFVCGTVSKALATSIIEKKIQLSKIHDLQLLQKVEFNEVKDGSNLAFRRSSRL